MLVKAIFDYRLPDPDFRNPEIPGYTYNAHGSPEIGDYGIIAISDGFKVLRIVEVDANPPSSDIEVKDLVTWFKHNTPIR